MTMRECSLPPTITLARLYADQGYWRVAAEIYRELAYRQPDCDEATQALAEMEAEAEKLGGNAVIGVDLDYEVLGSNGSMLMVSCTGTAVTV